MSPQELQQRVADALDDAGVGPGRAVGVGCSGGPDSAALAHATATLASAGALGPVVLVHVDHQLRPDSSADAQVVRELAARVGGTRDGKIAVAVVTVAVDRRGASLERAARDARYRAFEQVIAERGLARLLLAHTGSDQAETVLMRAIRGTGVVGLAGIPGARGPYLRPWLAASRADIERYVSAHDLPTVRDPHNRDPVFFRNRVRHRWLPALRVENPNIEQALRQVARSARDHRDVLDYAAAALLERAAGLPDGVPADALPDAREVGLDVRPFADAPASVSARALALAFEAASGRAGSQSLTSRHVRALQQLLAGPSAGTRSLDLPGLRAVRTYDRLHLVPRLPDQLDDVDGTASSQPAGIAVIGPDAPYQIRTWQPGDRMRPARLRGRSRKLSDLFTDAKIPRAERRTAIVIVRPGDRAIVWAQHIGAAFAEPVQVALTRPAARARNTLNERR